MILNKTMHSTINKVLLLQLKQMYKKQGLKSLCLYLVKVFNYRVINRYFKGSYSQKGEDLMIDKYFNHKKKGFYIDIGASHPTKLSNTRFFYDKGWWGINVEPNPTRIGLFLEQRKRDINLNVGIGSRIKKAVFYRFEGAALSTFSEKEAKTLTKVGYKLKDQMKIQMQRLENIMKRYVKSDIDFMTVDTEGLDLEVLKSNDWKTFRPKLLVIETIDFIDLLVNPKKVSERKNIISSYLRSKGYREYFSNGLNTLYEDIQNINLT